MQNEMMIKARARRQVALSHLTSHRRDTTKVTAFRRLANMSPAELGDALMARRASQVENIFAA